MSKKKLGTEYRWQSTHNIYEKRNRSGATPPHPLSPHPRPRKKQWVQKLSALYSCEKLKKYNKNAWITVWKDCYTDKHLNMKFKSLQKWWSPLWTESDFFTKVFLHDRKMIFLVVLLLWNGNETAHATQGKQIFEDIHKKMYSS